MTAFAGALLLVAVVLLPMGFVWLARAELRAQEASAALGASEQRFRLAFDHSGVGMALVALDGRLIRVNRALSRILGWPEAELLARDFRAITHPDDLAADLAQVDRLLRGEVESYALEKRYLHPSGRVIWGRLTVSLAREAGVASYFVSQVEDVTERHEAEAATRTALREKEVLLRELQHRVKNNLQVISGLLALQARRAPEPASRGALEDARSRVHSIALLYELLHRSNASGVVVLGDYLREVVRSALHACGREDVAWEVAADGAALPLDATVPCGLIVNELVTNTAKHGFRDREHGRLRVTVGGAAGEVRIAVEDDGVGLPAGGAPPGRALGFELVRALVGQLDGRLEIGAGPGARIAIAFPLEEAA